MSADKTNDRDNLEIWRKRLIFRSSHRGKKEMDIIMASFAGQNVGEFDEEQLRQYEDILTFNDADLYDWLTGKRKAPEEVRSCPVFQQLARHRIA
ncbi:MAG: succinate dehydrogenase assembly factor 2 [Alphaproteobacteria bacterium]